MDDPETDRFTEVGAHALGTDAWLAAGEDDVLIATPTGHLELIDSTGTASTHDLDRDVVAVDLGKYVYVAGRAEVSAYTTSGIELWSTAVPSPTRLASLGRDGVIGCLRDDGRVVGLDTETGTDLFVIDRPHADVDQLNAVAGGHGLLAIGAWSFLSVIDTDGTVLFDRNLPSAIEAVAVVDDAAVVQLKNGDVQRIDLDSGDTVWTRSHSAASIVAFGDRETLSVDKDGLHHLDAHGNADPLDVQGGEAVAATADGGLIVVSGNGTQTVYRRGEPPESSLAADVITEAVRAGQPIRFRLTNEGADSLDVPLELRVTPEEALQVTGRTVKAELAPGETAERAVRVREVERTEETEVSLVTDGRTICQGSILPVVADDPREALEIESVVEGIGPEAYDVTLVLTNTASTDATVSIAGLEGTVAPGDAEFEVTLPRESGPEYSVTVEIDGHSAEVPVTLPLPDESPSVSVEAVGSPDEPFLDVFVEHPYDATLRDSLVVATRDGAFEMRRVIELGPGDRLRLAILLTESAIDDGLRIRAALQASQGRTEARLEPGMWAPSDSETGDTDDEPGEAFHVIRPDESASELTVRRQVPDTANRGERFDESITLVVEGAAPSEPAVIEIADEEFRWHPAGSPASLELIRQHAVFETGPVKLPEASVSVDSDTRPLPSRSVDIAAGPIALRAVATVSGTELTVEYVCRNTGTDPLRLEGLGIDPPAADPDVRPLDEPRRIPPGDEASISRGLDVAPAAVDEVFGAGVTVRSDQGSERAFWTLVEPPTTPGRGAASDRSDDPAADTMELAVRPSSAPIAGENVAIECALTANTDLSDVHVEARGDLVTPLSTGERRIGHVESGDTETYFVDIVSRSDSTAAFELDVEVGESHATDRTYRISGPVVSPGEDVPDDQWQAVRADAGNASGPSEAAPSTPSDETRPTHLTTRFREERGSPR